LIKKKKANFKVACIQMHPRFALERDPRSTIGNNCSVTDYWRS